MDSLQAVTHTRPATKDRLSPHTDTAQMSGRLPPVLDLTLRLEEAGADMGTGADGRATGTVRDNVFALFRRRCRRFRPVRCPRDGGAGPKRCFDNAVQAVLRHPRWLYAEGYVDVRRMGVPVHHAWVIDERGVALDPTLSDPSFHDYYGVAFPRDLALRMASDAAVYRGDMLHTLARIGDRHEVRLACERLSELNPERDPVPTSLL